MSIIKNSLIALLFFATIVLGYRELERQFGDSNTTLTEVRSVVSDYKKENAELRLLIEENDRRILEDNAALLKIYERQNNLNARIVVLENLSPATPPN